MEFKKITFIFDLDGTVYVDGILVPGVGDEIRRLHQAGHRFFYATNNTSLGSSAYEHKLQQLGLPVTAHCVISPTKVLIRTLQQHQIRRVYTVGTTSFQNDLSQTLDIDPLHPDPQWVVIAFDRELTYQKLEIACQHINRGVPYYLTHIDLACPSRGGPVPDCGAIGRLIESVTQKKPAGDFGKPGSLMVNYIQDLLGQYGPLVVAGDRTYTDMQLGIHLGARTVVVRTGEFSGNPDELPNGVETFDSLTKFLRTVPT